jgi:hypothetical protein
LNFSAEAKAGKFFVKQGKICSRSRAPTTKILTQYDEKFAACSPATKIQTASYRKTVKITHTAKGSVGQNFK